MFRSLSLALLSLAAPGLARADAPPPPADLTDYVGKADAAFAWKLAGKTETPAGTVYDLDLTSQTWQKIVWTHKLQVVVPRGVKPRATMVLWNQGGKPSPTSGMIAAYIAEKVGAPVAFLYGVPNQPLFGGKTEDALIAETFVKYLETKDSSWPLLFPMVKSVVRAMDALQAFARQEWKHDVTSFVVTGASKRGWTSWLTAATGDRRVKAIAPLVIDTLNMPVQMKNQVAAFGKPSEMIHDYTERKLAPIPETGEGRRLWSMVDPWVYRARLTLPKMIINGANDPYWPLDALNSYWDDLPGEKYVLYVPNAGHNLRERDASGKEQVIPERALNTLSAFCKCHVFDKPMPKPKWAYSTAEAKPVIQVKYDDGLKALRLWHSVSETRDFRKALWSGHTTPADRIGSKANHVETELVEPGKGFKAFFAECEYDVDGLRFNLSTQLQILEAKR